MHDQIVTWTTTKNTAYVSLRAEAVTAVIGLANSEDPLEAFDRVMLIHRVRYPG